MWWGRSSSFLNVLFTSICVATWSNHKETPEGYLDRRIILSLYDIYIFFFFFNGFGPHISENYKRHSYPPWPLANTFRQPRACPLDILVLIYSRQLCVFSLCHRPIARTKQRIPPAVPSRSWRCWNIFLHCIFSSMIFQFPAVFFHHGDLLFSCHSDISTYILALLGLVLACIALHSSCR